VSRICSEAIQNVLSGYPERDKANGNNESATGKSDNASAQWHSKVSEWLKKILYCGVQNVPATAGWSVNDKLNRMS